MSIQADHPAWLVAAGAFLAAGIALALRAPRAVLALATAGILLPALAAAGIAAALAGVALADNGRVLVLLDLSPSTRDSPWRNPEWVRALAEKRLGDRTPVAVAGFDGSATRLLLPDAPPGEAARWPAEWNWTPDTDAHADSGIDRALAWRLPGEAGNVAHLAAARWVITDGLFPSPENGGVPAAWTIVPPSAVDVGITDIALRSPDSSNPAAVEIQMQVRAVARPGAATPAPAVVHAQLQVSRDNVPVATVPVEFHGSATLDASRWVSVRDALPRPLEVPHQYRARISLTDGGGDPWPENDTAAIAYIPPGEMRTLVIGENEPAYPHTAFVRADDFAPRRDQLGVEGWQVIILDDLPATTLAPMLPAIDAAVRDDGTGLLILGSGHAFGPGGYGLPGAGVQIETLAPFWSHPHEGRHAHVVFLIDASASMNEAADDPARPGQTLPTRKITFAGNAVTGACDLLSGDDRITVIAFNAAAQVIADGTVSSSSAALPAKLAAIAPQGATVPDAALPAVAAALRGEDPDAGDVKHVLVLFTDGEIPAMDVPGWRAAISSSRASVEIIAPPVPGRSNSTLRQLAAMPGVVWSQSPTPLDWAAALQSAIAANVAGTLQDRPIHWTLNDPTAPLSADAASWTRVWKKPEALLLSEGTASDGAFPLVAAAQRGLGQVGAVAITNDRSPAYIDLVTRMARRVAAAPGDRRFTIACIHAPDGTWRITADGIGDAGFMNGESLAALVTYAGPQPSPTTPLPLRQTAPGHYELSLSHDPPTFFTVQRQTPGGLAIVGRGPVAAVETTEWPASVQSTFDPAAAHAVALSSALDNPTRWEIPSTAWLSLTVSFWILSALACLAALWLRR